MVDNKYLGVIFINKEEFENKNTIDIIESSLEKYRFDHVSNPFCVKSKFDLIKEGKKIYEDLTNDNGCFYSLYADVFNGKSLCKQKQGMLHICRERYPEKDNLGSVESNCGSIIDDIKGILQSSTEKDKEKFYINIFKHYNTQYVYDQDNFAYISYNGDGDKGFRIEGYPNLGLDTINDKVSYKANINELNIECMLDKKRKMYENMYELAKKTAIGRLNEKSEDGSWKENELVRAIFGVDRDDTIDTFVDRKMDEAAPIKSQVMIIDGEWYEYDCLMDFDDTSVSKKEYSDKMKMFLEKYRDTHVVMSINIIKELDGFEVL